jgi:hypothetical protein
MRALVLLALLIPAPGRAQEPAPAPATGNDIDVTKLGVSLSRIQKGLFIAETRQNDGGESLRLEFNVQVYGQAPKIEVLEGLDLFNGAVLGTAPSHRQVIEFLTPTIYRSPTMPVSALALWAATPLWQKFKRARCEKEIASYRALLMQGIDVAAPRCTQ